MSWSRNEKAGSSSDEHYVREVLEIEENLSYDNSDMQEQVPSLFDGTWQVEQNESHDMLNHIKRDDSKSIFDGVMPSADDINRLSVVIMLEESLNMNNACEDTCNALLPLSNSERNCLALKESGCPFLLIEIIHARNQNPVIRKNASRVLYNITRATQDSKFGRQELHVLGLIEQLRDYSELLQMNIKADDESLIQSHPLSALSALTKLSFNKNHQHAMCQMGILHAIHELIEMDHVIHGSDPRSPHCISVRKYAGTILFNLTFGYSKNKHKLCTFEKFVETWVAQLQNNDEDVQQITASVLRNLSWRATPQSKDALREADSVKCLTVAAMKCRRESTLKSILSALWTLSAHCEKNKYDICRVEGALSFLVDLLGSDIPSKQLTIVENAGGILRNITNVALLCSNYKKILRKKNCLHIAVKHLNSPSYTIVSNACGILWNFSERDREYQQTLWKLGVVPILRNLMRSVHRMVSKGATATLRNLLIARKETKNFTVLSDYRSNLEISEQEEQVQQQQKPQQITISTSVIMEMPRPPVLGASCRSRSAEDSRQNHSEDRPMSSKSWHSSFSRHPSSPLEDEESQNDDETSINIEKLENNAKNTSERNKCSPRDSPYFEERLATENSSFELDGDQPIDYSIKYVENVGVSNKQDRNLKIKSVRRDKAYHQERNANIFGDYAETDLDQPTDYSLRYAEDDTDDEEKQNIQYFNEQEDTIKTYCTEGTPYETPCNFSTATSMLNLRLEDSKDSEGSKKVYKKPINLNQKEFENDNVLENKELHHEVTESTKINSIIETNDTQHKPVYYYDEGSPGAVSRVNSLSSLELATHSEDVTNETSKESENIEQKEEKSEEGSPIESVVVIEDKDIENNEEKTTDKEGKVVTFNGEDHYAEETPLMFSRSSSLGSLSGFEQYSIHDDRSSIISDFSRRTSGIISPSELPDSPTQTVPPSPRHRKNSIDCTMRTPDERRLSSSKFSFQKPKASVFEDDTAAFKEESTPIEFSAATSLSSLTIDDDPKPSNNHLLIGISTHEQVEKNQDISSVPSPAISEKETDSHENIEINDRGDVSDGDEEDGDEDILAACINMGMQNNRYRQNFRKTEPKTFPSSVSNLIRYQTSSTLDRLESVNNTETKRASLSPLKTKSSIDSPISDSVHVYCTEDTPADISPVGSQSNLSALSLPSIVEDFEKPDELEEARNDSCDDNSNLSGDDEKILDECIQSGMPKRISPTVSTMTTKNKSDMFSSRSNDFTDSLSSSGTRDNREYLMKAIDERCESSNNSYENSPNHSDDDDAILAECIESAMPKVRPNFLATKVSTSRQSDATQNGFDSSKIDQLKSPRSEDSLSMSEDEGDMILAQCIQSGMPKATTSAINFPSGPRDDTRRLYGVLSSPRNSSPRQIVQRRDYISMASRDEISNFATEDTPCNFSVASEISNLSINSDFD